MIHRRLGRICWQPAGDMKLERHFDLVDCQLPVYCIPLHGLPAHARVGGKVRCTDRLFGRRQRRHSTRRSPRVEDLRRRVHRHFNHRHLRLRLICPSGRYSDDRRNDKD